MRRAMARCGFFAAFPQPTVRRWAHGWRGYWRQGPAPGAIVRPTRRFATACGRLINSA